MTKSERIERHFAIWHGDALSLPSPTLSPRSNLPVFTLFTLFLYALYWLQFPVYLFFRFSRTAWHWKAQFVGTNTITDIRLLYRIVPIKIRSSFVRNGILYRKFRLTDFYDVEISFICLPSKSAKNEVFAKCRARFCRRAIFRPLTTFSFPFAIS